MKKLLFYLVSSMLISNAAAQNATPEPEPLKINFKNRGYFYAASPPLNSTSGLGGWGSSANTYQVLENPSRYDASKVIVHIEVSKPALYAEKYKGYALCVVNTLTDTLFFDVQDSRLTMKLQARDRDGEWKDIEYLPSSWCGNSYHMLYLPANCFWSFTIPAYEGKIKTHIRAALAWKNSRESQEQWVYSNEVAAGINPGQFSKMPAYNTNGIMDPYTN